MNTDLLHRIADEIEKRPDKFNMNYFCAIPMDHPDWTPAEVVTKPHTMTEFFKCDAVACVAGWACLLEDASTEDAAYTASILLDIDYAKAYQLFYPSEDTFWGQFTWEFGWEWPEDGDSYGHIEPKQAADVLRRLADGEVEL